MVARLLKHFITYGMVIGLSIGEDKKLLRGRRSGDGMLIARYPLAGQYLLVKICGIRLDG